MTPKEAAAFFARVESEIKAGRLDATIGPVLTAKLAAYVAASDAEGKLDAGVRAKIDAATGAKGVDVPPDAQAVAAKVAAIDSKLTLKDQLNAAVVFAADLSPSKGEAQAKLDAMLAEVAKATPAEAQALK